MMKFRRGDIVTVKPDGHWNMKCWRTQQLGVPMGIVLYSYEGDQPSYKVLVGLQHKWVYETDLDV